MSNKNENNFTLLIVQGGGLLKLDIMLRKANELTYIWRFSENLENYRKLILWWEDCILAVDIVK